MTDFKKQIDELCDYALLHSEDGMTADFGIDDLSNATQILLYVAFSLLWKNSHERNGLKAVAFGRDGIGLARHVRQRFG